MKSSAHLVFMSVCGFAMSASADIVVDQTGATFISGGWNSPVLQSFMPAEGNLAAVEVWIYGSGALEADVTLSVFQDSAQTQLVASGIDLAVQRGSFARIDFAAVEMTPETSYYLRVDIDGALVAGGNRSNEYARGQLIFGGGNISGGDLRFNTYYDNNVPTPASAMLLGGAGLLATRRRRG